MDFFTNLWDRFVGGFPDIVIAIILLVIAFLVALLAKVIVMAILKKLGAEKLISKTGVVDEKAGSSTAFVGKLIFLIVFLLFLPAALNRLGMSSVAAPITSVVSSIIAFLPNLLAAGIILFIGAFVAKVIRQLLESLLNRIGLNKLQKKMGVEVIQSQSTFASVLSGIVYVVILIPVIIMSLNVLGLEAVSVPAANMLSEVFSYLPSIFVAIALFVVGYFIAKLVAPLIENLLSSLGVDKLNEKIIPETKGKSLKFSISKVIGQIVRYLILVIFLIQALNVLKLQILTDVGEAILNYLPLVVSAIIILGGGVMLAYWLEHLIADKSPQRKTAAFLVKITVIVFAAFMTLSQLGFAQDIVNYSFIIILAGVGVAFAIAFGIGGRAFAANRLSKIEKKLDVEENPETKE